MRNSAALEMGAFLTGVGCAVAGTQGWPWGIALGWLALATASGLRAAREYRSDDREWMRYGGVAVLALLGSLYCAQQVVAR
jgi:hypothetical protein